MKEPKAPDVPKVRQRKDKGYHKLLVWQRAREFVLLTYQFTEKFPKSEEFGIKGQLRRAAVSVMLTIVEGYRRNSKKDFLHFLNIATSSLAEVEAAWEVSLDLKFVSEEDYVIVENKRAEVAYLLEAFILSINK